MEKITSWLDGLSFCIVCDHVCFVQCHFIGAQALTKTIPEWLDGLIFCTGHWATCPHMIISITFKTHVMISRQLNIILVSYPNSKKFHCNYMVINPSNSGICLSWHTIVKCFQIKLKNMRCTTKMHIGLYQIDEIYSLQWKTLLKRYLHPLSE